MAVVEFEVNEREVWDGNYAASQALRQFEKSSTTTISDRE